MLFDDSLPVTATSDVIVSTAHVFPVSTTFDNSARDYTLSGGFGIGSGPVTKRGTARVTINTENGYGGNTQIYDGPLRITRNNALGAGGVNTSDLTVVWPGGALELEGGITVPEHFHFFAHGPDGKGGLRSIGGHNTLTTAFAMDSDATIGVDADSLTSTSLFYQDFDPAHPNYWTLNKVGAGLLVFSGQNSYPGQTRIAEGTISVSSLNKVTGGSPASNLGAPADAAKGTIALGRTDTTGTLRYTGAGETTDRIVDLAGTVGGGVIDQSGATGLLKFTNAFTATGAGGKTLTLKGSTLGTGEIAGVIADHSVTNKTSLDKSGTGTWTLSGGNTYSGRTRIMEGTLNVTSLNSVAGPGHLAASSLGAPTTVADGTIALGGVNPDSTGTLRTSGGGAETDRVIDLAGTTGGGVLDQSGVGLLRFTSDFTATGAGSKTLTLTGSTAGTGEIAGAIVDHDTAMSLRTSLTKAGTGTWTLSGDNTYSGQTTISAGTLSIASDNGLGAAAIDIISWTIVLGGAALELQGGITVPEHFHFNGNGPEGKGGLRSVSGDNTLTTSFALDSNSGIGVDTDLLTIAASALIYQDVNPNNPIYWTLTKIGAGTLNLNGLVNVHTLVTNAGTTNLNNTLSDANGTLGATLNANATTNISVSQTLAALNITDDAVVTLGPIPMSPALEAGGIGDASFAAQGNGVAGVPEPGSIALLLAGALALESRKRKTKGGK